MKFLEYFILIEMSIVSNGNDRLHVLGKSLGFGKQIYLQKGSFYLQKGLS